MATTAAMREIFAAEYEVQRDRNRLGPTIDMAGASFLADDDTIFGKPDQSYIDREIEWYIGQSLYVDDIPGRTPKIWKDIASREGKVNSNYGYLVFSAANGAQFTNVVNELSLHPTSRRATMIYTRPTMHRDSVADGMTDFVCTNAVTYRIDENGDVVAIVQMRSNDVVYGYRNDVAWQKYMLLRVTEALREKYPTLQPGPIIWQAASLHIYARHYPLLEHFLQTGDFNVQVSKFTSKEK